MAPMMHGRLWPPLRWIWEASWKCVPSCDGIHTASILKPVLEMLHGSALPGCSLAALYPWIK